MKKLMIAAAAAMIGIAAHAAAVTWNVAIPEMDSSYAPAVGGILLATGGDSWNFTFDETGSALGAINGDTTGIFASGTEWTATITAELLKEDYSAGGTFTKTYAFTIPALTGDPTQDEATFGTLNNDIAAAFLDTGMTGALPTAEAALSQGWAAVPEPTSGLLLLLGVAGLALRRRRA